MPTELVTKTCATYAAAVGERAVREPAVPDHGLRARCPARSAPALRTSTPFGVSMRSSTLAARESVNRIDAVPRASFGALRPRERRVVPERPVDRRRAPEVVGRGDVPVPRPFGVEGGVRERVRARAVLDAGLEDARPAVGADQLRRHLRRPDELVRQRFLRPAGFAGQERDGRRRGVDAEVLDEQRLPDRLARRRSAGSAAARRRRR